MSETMEILEVPTQGSGNNTTEDAGRGREDEQVVPVPLNVAETSSSVRERKKKKKKRKPVLEEQIIEESDISIEDGRQKIEELKKVTHEKDGKIKSVEDLLEAELLKVASKEKTVQDLKQELEALKEEIGGVQLEKAPQLSITSQVLELQNLVKGKEKQMNTMQAVIE
ncbi:Kinectin [Fukomys damarensis]|uniref:Kinectin n=1 Tax=Fukomys damarensis TaxID=885580 RepID=A0A091DKS9_FUKDA|nr:Kinectin [Fukomys damarensis]